QPIEKVRDQIRAKVERAEAMRLAKEAGTKKLADLATVASDAGFGKPHTVSRSKPEGVPEDALKAIMRAPAAKLPTYVGASVENGGYGIFQVLSAKVPAQTDAARKDQLTRSLQQTIGNGDDAAYVAALKTKYKAEVLNADLKPETPETPEKANKETNAS